MSYYKDTAADILRYIKPLIKLRYSEFQMLNKAILFLENDYDEEAETPDFQISITKEDFSVFHLTFESDGFRFLEFIHDFDNNSTPIDIFVKYETGQIADYSDGNLDDWEEVVEFLLSQYNPDDDENEVSINFTDSY